MFYCAKTTIFKNLILPVFTGKIPVSDFFTGKNFFTVTGKMEALILDNERCDLLSAFFNAPSLHRSRWPPQSR